MNDKYSAQRIQEVHPKYRDVFTNFINDAEAAHNTTFRIMEPVFRTIAQQNALYAQGRNGDTRPIVTNAPGGASYHNYGLAIDICHLNPDNSVDWNYDMSLLKPIAAKYALEWGGDWKHQDKPHWELRLGYSQNCQELLAKYNAGEVDANGYLTTI